VQKCPICHTGDKNPKVCETCGYDPEESFRNWDEFRARLESFCPSCKFKLNKHHKECPNCGYPDPYVEEEYFQEIALQITEAEYFSNYRTNRTD
jgi:predicted amidophosphoribosyltransferase